MRRIFLIILILLAAALSGCVGSSEDELQVGTQTFERTNLDLDGKIVDLKLLPEDVSAGEDVSADLVVANTGKENIINETIYIKAKVKTLDDFFANLALKAVSDDMKTKVYTMDFEEEIKPGTNKPISAVFHTVKEMKGKNLAGKYSVMVILSVNGQKVDSRVIQFTLNSGKSKKPNSTQSNATPTVTVTSAPTSTFTPVPTITSTPAPTPEPTPEAVTVEPSGIIRVTRIMGYKFGEPSVTIDAGDTLQWYNLDEDTMNLVEVDGKMDNISV
ncbi:MAG: hypothetical protein O8C60_06095, partial [Candidatus Methanoperedens sp.]|nr:hypothetical protein [Candidatus Methanoperedens sp.]